MRVKILDLKRIIREVLEEESLGTKRKQPTLEDLIKAWDRIAKKPGPNWTASSTEYAPIFNLVERLPAGKNGSLNWEEFRDRVDAYHFHRYRGDNADREYKMVVGALKRLVKGSSPARNSMDDLIKYTIIAWDGNVKLRCHPLILFN